MEIVATDRDAIDNNCTASADAIRAFFDKLRGLLTHREAALLATVQEYGDKKLSKLETHRQSLHESRDAIRREVEKMHQHNQNVQLVIRKQTVTERLHAHQQSVLRTQHALVELKSSYSFLSFEEDDDICQELSSLGSLNERYTQPDSTVPIVRPLEVSEYEVRPNIYESSPVPQLYIESQKRDIPYYMSHPSRKTCNRGQEPLLPIVNIVAPGPEDLYEAVHEVIQQDPLSHKMCNGGPENLYEAVYEVIQQDPSQSGVNPPPLPPNHPSRHSFDFGSFTIGGNSHRPPKKTSGSKSLTLPLCSTQLHGQGKIINTPDVGDLNEEQTLTDGLDSHQQFILDVESQVSKSMCSSTCVGFKKEPTENQLGQADSGYYSARVIKVEDSSTKDVTNKDGGDPEVDQDDKGNVEEHSSIATSEKKLIPTDDESLVSSASEEEPAPEPQSQPQPEEVTQPNLSQIRRPSFPVRFESMIAISPLVQPERIYDKLSRLKFDIIHPCGVCVGLSDSLVITDNKNHCLRFIASNGKFIDSVGREGKGSGQFEDPCGLAIDHQENILVCQRENPRIQRFSSAGKFIQKFGQRSLLGSVLGEPWGLAVAPDGKIFVSDWDKNCIHIFQSNGRYVRALGGEKESTLVKLPAGIAFDKKGNLLVADRKNHCIWILESDGKIVAQFGMKGSGPGELYYPYGVAVCQDGSIVVSESGNHRISVFSSSGQFEGNFGQRGSEPGMFDHPRQVCINSKGEIIVADEMNKRLQIFKL